MAIRILTDSAADYEPHEIKERELICLPLSITFGDETFQDGFDLSKDEFYRRLLTREHFPKTSQAPLGEYIPHFEAARDAGDDIICIMLSGGLSGTVQSARMAAEMVDYDGIHIIDSLTAVTGQRMLVDTAVQRAREGKSAAEIVEEILDMRGRMTIYAMINTMDYLLMGGRVSKVQATLGGALNIKPIIHVNAEGGLDVPAKAMGQSRAFKILLDYMDKFPRDEAYPIYYPFSHNDANLQKFLEYLREKKPGIDTTHCYNLGPTIGTHIGDACFGFTYVRK